MGSNIDVSSTAPLINRLMNPPDMGAQFAKGLDTLNAWKNFQAQQASANAVQQAVDPVTGAVDMGKYNALLSQGPGAFNFGPLARQAGEAVGAQGQATTADVQSKMAQLGATSQFMYPLLQKATSPGGVVSPQEAQAALDQAHGLGLINNQVYQRTSTQIAQIPPGGNANSIVIGASMGNDAAMRALQPEYQGAGGYIFQRNPMAYGGAPAAGPVVVATPSADLRAQPVVLTVGNQQIPNVPYDVASAITQNPDLLKQYYPNIPYNQGDPVRMSQPAAPALPSGVPAPAASGTAPGAAVTNRSFAPNAQPGRAGRYPGEVQPPASAPAPAAPAAAPTPAAPAASAAPLWAQPPTPVASRTGAGGVGFTPSAAYLANLQKITQPAVDAEQQFSDQVRATRDIEPILNDMQAQLSVPGFETGVGTTAVNSVRQLAQKFGLAPQEGTGTTEAMRAQDEFNKDAARLQAAQVTALGNPSDARQDLASAANPGSLQSQYGNKGIVQMLIGNQQALRIENDAWQKAKANGWTAGGDENNNFKSWQTDRWLATDPSTGGRFDQRVFALANAPTAAEQRTFAQKIPAGQGRDQFIKNLTYANKMGWIKTDKSGLTTVVSP